VIFVLSSTQTLSFCFEWLATCFRAYFVRQWNQKGMHSQSGTEWARILKVCLLRKLRFRYRNLSVKLTFWITELIISSQDRGLYNKAPRYLTEEVHVDLMSVPLQDILRELHFFKQILEPKRINSVFPRWSDSLLSTKHALKDWISFDNSCSICSPSLPVTKIADSSANNRSCYWQQLTCH